MVGYVVSDTFAHTSDATFRAWGKGMSDQLTAVGLAKTADTGQIDWATVARPTTNTWGYEIRRMSDSLDTASPIFIKIEYGTGGAVTRPGLRISTGTGSNGAGTLTGLLTGPADLAPTSNVSYNTTIAMCRVDGAFWCSWITAVSGYGNNVWAIFRPQDSSGTVTGEDWTVVVGLSGTSHTLTLTAYCCDRSASVVRSGTDFYSVPFPARPSGYALGRVLTPSIFAYPALTLCDGMLQARSTAGPEYTHYQSFSATVFPGKPRTYLHTPHNNSTWFCWIWE